MKALASIAIFFFSLNSWGATGQMKVVQVVKSQHIVIAKGSKEKATVGKTYLVNFSDDHQCSIVLHEQQGDQYTFSTSSCDREDQLKKNLTIEAALTETPAPVAQPEQEKGVTVVKAPESSEGGTKFAQRIRFGLSLHYSTADEIRFDDTDDLGDARLNTEGAFGVGVRAAMLEENSWGFIASLDHEFKRKIDSATGNLGTVTVNNLDISYLIFEGAAAYRWGFFYLPFGLNYSIPMVSGDDDLTGAFGLMVGAGFMFTENASLELLVRTLGVRFKDEDDDDEAGPGYLTGFAVKGNIWF